jgi:hypothetical protein
MLKKRGSLFHNGSAEAFVPAVQLVIQANSPGNINGTCFVCLVTAKKVSLHENGTL